MKTVSEILRDEKAGISFEVFPPKKSTSMDAVLEAARQIAALHPRFVSVTYGAGGGGSEYTLELSAALQRDTGVPVLAHMTCVNAMREDVLAQALRLRQSGIRSIMALRGDLPPGMEPSEVTPFHHASDLIRELLSAWPEVCIGGACYPEIHPESASRQEDILYLKEKTETGCAFLTTQMFFDNDLYYRFLDDLRAADITVPVIPGIMPITSRQQLERAASLSGAYLPPRLLALAERYGGDPGGMLQAGTDYAAEQMLQLYDRGVRHIHVYTMNKTEVAREVMDRVRSRLGEDI